jgi:hypothetical protein
VDVAGVGQDQFPLLGLERPADRDAHAKEEAASGLGLGPYAPPRTPASAARQADGDPALARSIEQVHGMAEEFSALNAAPRAGEATMMAPAPTLDPTTASAAAQAASQAAASPAVFEALSQLATFGRQLPPAYDPAKPQPTAPVFDVLG